MGGLGVPWEDGPMVAVLCLAGLFACSHEVLQRVGKGGGGGEGEGGEDSTGIEETGGGQGTHGTSRGSSVLRTALSEPDVDAAMRLLPWEHPGVRALARVARRLRG